MLFVATVGVGVALLLWRRSVALKRAKQQPPLSQRKRPSIVSSQRSLLDGVSATSNPLAGHEGGSSKDVVRPRRATRASMIPQPINVNPMRKGGAPSGGFNAPVAARPKQPPVQAVAVVGEGSVEMTPSPLFTSTSLDARQKAVASSAAFNHNLVVGKGRPRVVVASASSGPGAANGRKAAAAPAAKPATGEGVEWIGSPIAENNASDVAETAAAVSSGAPSAATAAPHASNVRGGVQNTNNGAVQTGAKSKRKVLQAVAEDDEAASRGSMVFMSSPLHSGGSSHAAGPKSDAATTSTTGPASLHSRRVSTIAAGIDWRRNAAGGQLHALSGALVGDGAASRVCTVRPSKAALPEGQTATTHAAATRMSLVGPMLVASEDAMNELASKKAFGATRRTQSKALSTKWVLN